jgi:hypothetical protein
LPPASAGVANNENTETAATSVRKNDLVLILQLERISLVQYSKEVENGLVPNGNGRCLLSQFVRPLQTHQKLQSENAYRLQKFFSGFSLSCSICSSSYFTKHPITGNTHPQTVAESADLLDRAGTKDTGINLRSAGGVPIGARP